jgi:hypothetical protein
MIRLTHVPLSVPNTLRNRKNHSLSLSSSTGSKPSPTVLSTLNLSVPPLPLRRRLSTLPPRDLLSPVSPLLLMPLRNTPRRHTDTRAAPPSNRSRAPSHTDLQLRRDPRHPLRRTDRMLTLHDLSYPPDHGDYLIHLCPRWSALPLPILPRTSLHPSTNDGSRLPIRIDIRRGRRLG